MIPVMDSETEKNKGILAVSLSGGVDSSVAAYILAEEWDKPGEGRRIIGVSHFIWPDSKTCNEETIGRAARVCSRLGIPFRRYDMVEDFTRSVVHDFIDTYIAGETPNPCVRCNERVRFQTFYKRIASEAGEDGERLYFATGHYVRRKKIDDKWFLRRGVDGEKDQSYMLYKIDPSLLPYLRFPLGDYTKPEVVALAEKAGLPTASVKESQDICFIGDDYPNFICGYPARYSGQFNVPIDEKKITGACGNPGEIVDTGGRPLGEHRGYIHYTTGQRKGLGLSNGPWYVVRIDAEKNRVVVGRKEEGKTVRVPLSEANWFITPPAKPLRGSVKIRYNSPDIPCRVEAKGTAAEAVLDTPASVTPGQSAVFYDGDIVLGGGIIQGNNG